MALFIKKEDKKLPLLDFLGYVREENTLIRIYFSPSDTFIPLLY